jgi:mono/diheme cytochrome c family protein
MKGLLTIAGALGVAILGAGFWWMSQGEGAADAGAASVAMPELSATAVAGQQAFAENCATCHGARAAGTDQGPPLIHKIYESGHHADLAFARAVRQGVRGHHWNFGDMPPVEGVSDRDLVEIVTYVREVQRANGIR